MKSIEEIAESLKRPASVMVVDGTPPPDDAFASKFGRVTAARHGEGWPLLNASPMVPLCQINLSEAGNLPTSLQATRFLTVFVSNRAREEYCLHNAPNGKGWLLRAYSEDDQLVPIEEPAVAEPAPTFWKRLFGCKEFRLKPSRIALSVVDDYPDLGELETLCPQIQSYWKDHEAEIETAFDNCTASKIGGWPSYIQDAIFYGIEPRPDYVFQIASEPQLGLIWGDLGIASFGLRSGEEVGTWYMDTNYT